MGSYTAKRIPLVKIQAKPRLLFSVDTHPWSTDPRDKINPQDAATKNTGVDIYFFILAV